MVKTKFEPFDMSKCKSFIPEMNVPNLKNMEQGYGFEGALREDIKQGKYPGLEKFHTSYEFKSRALYYYHEDYPDYRIYPVFADGNGIPLTLVIRHLNKLYMPVVNSIDITSHYMSINKQLLKSTRKIIGMETLLDIKEQIRPVEL